MDPRSLFCLYCGYDLRGKTESRCPERGFEFDPVELRRILNPNAKPIGNSDLVFKLIVLPVFDTVLAAVLAVLGGVFLNSPIPPLLCMLLLLVYLYRRTDLLVPRLLSNINAHQANDRNHKRMLFLLHWGVPLLLLLQIGVVIGTAILIFAFLLPDLS